MSSGFLCKLTPMENSGNSNSFYLEHSWVNWELSSRHFNFQLLGEEVLATGVMLPLAGHVRRWETAVQGLDELEISAV